MTINLRFNLEKTIEATTIILNLNNGRMPYLKLLKLLYLADREAFKLWERPITYDNYAALDNGPIPSKTYNLIKSGADPSNSLWSKNIQTSEYDVRLLNNNNNIKLKKLSQAEIELLTDLSIQHKDVNRWKLVDYTHTLPEYIKPNPGSSTPISYELLLKKGLNFTDEDILRIAQSLEEEEELSILLGD